MRRATRYALVLAGGYALLAGAYIVLSGRIAALLATSVDDLERIEQTKGVVYVVVTAVLLFVATRWAMLRLQAATERIVLREHALLVHEGRVLAGLIASSIAHDANNVLTAELGELALLEAEIGDNEHLQRLRDSTRRLTELNRKLVGLSQRSGGEPTSELRLAEAARDSVAMLRKHAHLRGCRVAFTCESDARVQASPLAVNQMVGNLVLNAGEATGGRGRVEVRIVRRGNRAVIEVHDDGPGVPRERRGDLFTALTSTKEHGSGLGLFSVKACAEAIGGTVAVGDSELGGACFRVEVPVAPEAESARSATSA